MKALTDEPSFERLKFHSFLLALEGVITILFIFMDRGSKNSHLPITALFPLVLYTYGMNSALSTAVLLFVKWFKVRWYWVLSLHILGLLLMFGLSILVFSVFTPMFLDFLQKF
jgi:hypothetical protein